MVPIATVETLPAIHFPAEGDWAGMDDFFQDISQYFDAPQCGDDEGKENKRRKVETPNDVSPSASPPPPTTTTTSSSSSSSSGVWLAPKNLQMLPSIISTDSFQQQQRFIMVPQTSTFNGFNKNEPARSLPLNGQVPNPLTGQELMSNDDCGNGNAKQSNAAQGAAAILAKDLTPEQLEVRRKRNREHAKRSRSRKKGATESLAAAVEALKEENEKLRSFVYSHLGNENNSTAEHIQRVADEYQSKSFIDALKQPQNKILKKPAIRFLKNLTRKMLDEKQQQNQVAKKKISQNELQQEENNENKKLFEGVIQTVG